MTSHPQTTSGTLSQAQLALSGAAAAILALASSLLLRLTPLSAPTKTAVGAFVFMAALALFLQRMRKTPGSVRYWSIMLLLALAIAAGSWSIAAA